MTKNNSSPPALEAIKLTKFWQDYGPNTYPLNIGELIDGAISNSSFQAKLVTKIAKFESFEGCLLRAQESNDWTILLNSQIENVRRLRFTHAHELGHFMCHRNLRDKFEDSNESLNNFNDEIEKQANVFASWLLMPANVVRAEFNKINWSTSSLCEIGNHFECSLQASALRYMELASKPIAFIVSRDGMIRWACKNSAAPFIHSFMFGDELPNKSAAFAAFQSGNKCQEAQDSGFAWNDQIKAKESQYFDGTGMGYQYTCIQFE